MVNADVKLLRTWPVIIVTLNQITGEGVLFQCCLVKNSRKNLSMLHFVKWTRLIPKQGKVLRYKCGISNVVVLIISKIFGQKLTHFKEIIVCISNTLHCFWFWSENLAC